MPPHRLEVADVIWKHGRAYVAEYGVSADQKRVLRDVAVCRTAVLGGHVKRCNNCGHEEFFYKSCGNRHCPKCQAAARAKWLDARASDLLETHYFHVVFTLPHKLGPIALQNKRVIYGVLFRAVSETLLKIARDPKHLGANIGFLAVLHTWSQNLLDHAHIHCVVPGGGLSPDGKKWIRARKNFFVHVKVLSRVFRGKFLDYLRQAFKDGGLCLEGKLRYLKDHAAFQALVNSLKRKEWVVYAKPPFGGPKQVLKYLARYTHRVAISNQRLITMTDDSVSFRWKDYAHGNRLREMTLKPNEFIRRFLLHVLPSGFQRIRQYGFLANRIRNDKLALCRKLLGQKKEPEARNPQDVASTDEALAEDHRADSCPECKKGRMVPIADIEPELHLREKLFDAPMNDTS